MVLPKWPKGSSPIGDLARWQLEPQLTGDQTPAGTVVLVHGFPDTSNTWLELGPLLAEVGYTVVRYDRRGCGESWKNHADPISARRHVEDLTSIVSDLRARPDLTGPIHVVGHDWGAQIAWISAQVTTDRSIASVAGLGTPFIAPEEDPATKYRPKMDDPDDDPNAYDQMYLYYFMERTCDLRKEIRPSPKTWLEGLYRTSAARHLNLSIRRGRRFMDGFLDADNADWLPDGYVADLAPAFAHDRTRAVLGVYSELSDDFTWFRDQDPAREFRSDTPALYLAGALDETSVLFTKQEDDLHKHFPKLDRIVKVPNSGHWVHLEHANEVAAELLRFWAPQVPCKKTRFSAKAVLDSMRTRFQLPTNARAAHSGTRRRDASGIGLAGRLELSPAASAVLARVLGDPSMFTLPEFGQNRRGDVRGYEVQARFSTTSPEPTTTDGDDLEWTDTLGLAVHVTDGGPSGDLVAVNVPVFLANDPMAFANEVLPALEERQEHDRNPEPDDRPDRLDRLVNKYRNAECHADLRGPLTAFGRQLLRGWPSSVAQTTYHSNHAFGFPLGTAMNPLRWARFRFEPAAGDRTLSFAPQSKQPDYREEVRGRVSVDGTIVFTIVLELASPAEPLNDPTVAWPETLQRFILGRLILNEPIDDLDDFPFDPTRPPAGIKTPISKVDDPTHGGLLHGAAEDEILKARHHIYQLSRSTRIPTGGVTQ